MSLSASSRRFPRLIQDSEFLFLANIDPVLQARVRSHMPKVSMVCGDTMNYWIKDHAANLAKVLRELDVLLINDGEARMLSGETESGAGGGEGAGDGAEVAGGEAWRVWRDGVFRRPVFRWKRRCQRPFRAPALPLAEVVDPTGAGDSFAGGFYGYLASQPELTPAVFRKAMFYGGVMGSFAVERFGTERLQAVTREEIDARFELFREISHLDYAGAESSAAERDRLAAAGSCLRRSGIDADEVRPATREETPPVAMAAVLLGFMALMVCFTARLSAAVWRCGGASGDRAADSGFAQSGAGAAGRSVAAAAAPADAAVCAEDGVVAERAGGCVAFDGLLHAGGGGVLSAVPADAGAAMGAGGDGVLCAESEPAVSLDDGDDGAAVSGAADLDDAADGGVRGGDTRGRQCGCARRLVGLGWLIFAAVFTRYDGWVLGAAVWCVVTWQLWRAAELWRRVVGRISSIFTLLAVAGPVGGSGTTSTSMHDPLDFMRGPYSAPAIEKRTSPPGSQHYRGWHNPGWALLFYTRTAQVDAAAWETGFAVMALALAGLWIVDAAADCAGVAAAVGSAGVLCVLDCVWVGADLYSAALAALVLQLALWDGVAAGAGAVCGVDA